MTPSRRTIYYTETIERKIEPVDPVDTAMVVNGIRDGSMRYEYDDIDRHKGVIRDVNSGQVVVRTDGDYGMTMSRKGFHTQVAWPGNGILGWIHRLFLRRKFVQGG